MAPANESKSGGRYEGIQTRLLIGHKHNREKEHFNGPRSITIQACHTRLSRFLQQKPRADSAIKYTSRPLSSVGIGSQGSEEGSQVDILVEKNYTRNSLQRCFCSRDMREEAKGYTELIKLIDEVS